MSSRLRQPSFLGWPHVGATNAPYQSSKCFAPLSAINNCSTHHCRRKALVRRVGVATLYADHKRYPHRVCHRFGCPWTRSLRTDVPRPVPGSISAALCSPSTPRAPSTLLPIAYQ
ncbi:hypothetical protein CPAR01_02571 [Colletotrichum paranaense]|uniref:Uncharacterized protein n=1 Tax=Colletotrichum paranaense TaxID=1914294 RepID=A0ABQ9SZZ5_9PEZI|nr:uncharacterized protein CPAR01_02571 [Colletotrichum paranaense]KAK1545069.1 hypothetical protein CPAR01_02571 [Colletotrichum paranaense]